MSSSKSKILLGYWDIRGLAQPIRLLLAYAGADFEERRYTTIAASDFDKSEWALEKANNKLNLAFPNLPYLVDGSVKLSQSHAIMRYLGRKFNLIGTTEIELAHCELVEQQIADLRTAFMKLCYSPSFERLQEGTCSKADCLGVLNGGFIDRFAHMLQEISAFLGERKWFLNEKLTYVDFLAYELLFQMYVWNSSVFKNVTNLTDFITRFEALPQISAYMKTDSYIKWPFNNIMASYGSRNQVCPF